MTGTTTVNGGGIRICAQIWSLFCAQPPDNVALPGYHEGSKPCNAVGKLYKDTQSYHAAGGSYTASESSDASRSPISVGDVSVRGGRRAAPMMFCVSSTLRKAATTSGSY